MALEVMAKAASPIALDVALRVEPGEMLALVGHSGSGKTTILRTIAGLWTPTEARVSVGGRTWLDTRAGLSLPTRARRVGALFQSYALFPHMTAQGNVMAALGDVARRARADEARRLLALVNLSGLEDRRPAELSGGQQQRVALARALARRPEVLLLDEPFSAVDRATREALYREIGALRVHLKMPTLFVTHDMDEARYLADRMAVIESGRIVRAGTTAEVMFDPAALRALGIREAGAFLLARIAGHDADGLTRLECSAGPFWLPRMDGATGTTVRVSVPAHEVLLSRDRPQGLSALNVFPATVEEIVAGEGGGALLRLRVGDDRLLARVTRRSVAALGLAPGVACHAVLKSMTVARDHVIAEAPSA